jgi:hypothetical protein
MLPEAIWEVFAAALHGAFELPLAIRPKSLISSGYRFGWRLNGSGLACPARAGPVVRISRCFRSFESSSLGLSFTAQKGLRAEAAIERKG